MGSAFEMSVDMSDIFTKLDALDVDARGLMRPAAQAGAQVFYDEVLLRVPVATKTVKRKSGKVIAPGALKASIYQAYSADNSSDRTATYHISWNARKAPHGHLIENGHWMRVVGKDGPMQPKWVAAIPFIRSSYDAAGSRAEQAVVARIDRGMVEILEKLQ